MSVEYTIELMIENEGLESLTISKIYTNLKEQGFEVTKADVRRIVDDAIKKQIDHENFVKKVQAIRCTATKRNGKPCKQTENLVEGYCVYHQGPKYKI